MMNVDGCMHNLKKYCVYHRDNAHDIKECLHQRNLIKDLIKDNKLKEFVVLEVYNRRQKMIHFDT